MAIRPFKRSLAAGRICRGSFSYLSIQKYFISPWPLLRPNAFSTHSRMARRDDSFELYDLRVEVVCPPGERIMCGAKAGDHFTLHGEMLHLPSGQGFSIYSLGTLDIRCFLRDSIRD